AALHHAHQHVNPCAAALAPMDPACQYLATPVVLLKRSGMASAAPIAKARTDRALNLAPSPNQALQRAALGIKCLAAGDPALRSPQRWRARVLNGRRAVAELSS